MKRPSIFFSCIRAFFLTVVIIFGIGIGIGLVTAGISALASAADKQLERETSLAVLPNADGVRKPLADDSPIILQIDIRGLIGGRELNTERVETQLMESREGSLKGDRVKAILLNIKTPGGSIFDSDGIFQAIEAYKEKYQLPVYAFVDGMCLSGGMYVAAAADKVYATDVSLVGSVGVIFLTSFNFHEAMESLGIKSATFTGGKGKDLLNPFRPWKKDEGENIEMLVDSYYQQFVDHVASHRPDLSKKSLVEEYGAKVFTAKQGVENGMIDGITPSSDEVLKELAKEAGIENYQVVRLESKRNMIKELLEMKSELFQGKIQHRISLGADPRAELDSPFLYLYHPQ